MPGFILHLTAAQMFLEMLPEAYRLSREKKEQNDFLAGTLLPDAPSDKRISHFRDPECFGKILEYPNAELFLEKYRNLIQNSICMGYYFHLYVDQRFFQEYLPRAVTYLDEKGRPSMEKNDVVKVRINRSGETPGILEFCSEEYYYGDYTKMNTYLVKRYHIPMELDTRLVNPGISEVDVGDISMILEKLCGYLQVPEEQVYKVKVFDVEELLGFLRRITKEFIEKNLREGNLKK